MSKGNDRREAGFKQRTRLADARDRVLAACEPHGRTETIPVTDADGRTLVEPVTADRDVPGYDRAAMDGYAVRAVDTFGAGDRSPTVLRVTDGTVTPDAAVRVHTGSELPSGADAVVMIEHADRVGEEVEVFDAAAEGENVAPADEDVAAGTELFDAGHRLRPSDLGMCRAVGRREVEVYDPPTVAVVPTGEELVAPDTDPEPGEVVETNGLTVSRLVERWGGEPRTRGPVTDDPEAIRTALTTEAEAADVVVTIGGSSVGERDLVPEALTAVGEVFVHGVALKPGHPVALGAVETGADRTPALALPGYPVACIVNAVQFLRPVSKTVGGMPVPNHPTTPARLARKLTSDPGVRTFARVRFDVADGQRVAVPTRGAGAGVLSSVAKADGWVEIREESEGLPEGEVVAVENWEWSS